MATVKFHLSKVLAKNRRYYAGNDCGRLMALDFLDKLTIITKKGKWCYFLRQIYLNYKSNKFQSPEKWLVIRQKQ